MTLSRESNTLRAMTGRIAQLQAVSWEWRDPDVFGEGRFAGILAQDLLTVLPHLVHEHDTGYLVVDYRGLTECLIETIKELDQRLTRLEILDQH